MSDSDNSKSDSGSSTPSKHTSTVPLKKETVRVTLKAADAPMAPPPAVAPTAPSAPAPPTAPPAPSVPKPPTAPSTSPAPPAPTIPLKSAGGGAPTTKPAPTIKLATPTGAGAPTIQLASPATKPAPAPGAPTAPAAPTSPGGPSVQLPKATVQLQPTQPLGTAGAPSLSQAATIQTADEDEEADGDTVATVLSIFGFVAALIVLALQIMTINIWDGWEKLF